MINGMTGFGSATITAGQVKGFIEIKSVNHRYFDVAYYLPVGFASLEEKIRLVIRKKTERGRINISLKIMNKPMSVVGFNENIAKSYIHKAHRLKKQLKLSGDLSLTEVIQLPGVVETRETILVPEAIWPYVQKGINKALDGLVAMRKREGAALSADIRDKLDGMSLRIKKIRERVKVIYANEKKRLSNDEFLSFQKGADINEEITRLIHHIEECRLLLKSKGSVGKRLDFVAQEMQRETNTIGSKLQDKFVANAVVSLKTKIEKLREQAQNIE